MANERKSMMAQLARYSHIGFVLPAATVAGWLVGSAADRWLGTTWLSVVGLVLGIVAGFIELVRAITVSESKE